MKNLIYKIFFTSNRKFSLADFIVVTILASIIYFGVELATHTPEIIKGPDISLSPSALFIYAFFSISRMFVAYLLSVFFTIVYGRMAAYNKKAEKFLIPALDVLQSVPILSFLPVVVLSLRVLLPQGLAAELASVVLIFTSQVWNMTFAWYQSLTTIPKDLQEASAINKLNGWQRFKNLEFPFGTISFIWNSMMSWAGGWFFLMAAEIFTVGNKDFRLPGLGSFLHEAADQGNISAIIYGIVALVIIIVLLDQFIWRPLLAWADKFKLEMVEGEEPQSSWFLDVVVNSNIINRINKYIINPVKNKLDLFLSKRWNTAIAENELDTKKSFLLKIFLLLLTIGLGYALVKAILMLWSISLNEWIKMFLGIGATFLRVFVSLLLAFIWTIPFGVLIGTNRKAARILQPIVQIFASIPATALFPVILLLVITLPFGVNIAAIILMLMGTQWYLLFNIIAGSSAIPQDLKYTSKLLHLKTSKRWKTLILPALFPYLVTGAIAASGGAWNASVVAEFVTFSGKTFLTTGIGSSIAEATAAGNFPKLLASTFLMIFTVVFINRFFWRRLYRLAEARFKMD
jgi:NitT/TauT family transport system permease protein